MVLSEPLEEDNWTVKKDINDSEGDGFVGFVHQALIDNYLNDHEAPEDVEFLFLWTSNDEPSSCENV